MTEVRRQIDPSHEQNGLRIRGPTELFADGCLRRERFSKESQGVESTMERRLWDSTEGRRIEAVFGDGLS